VVLIANLSEFQVVLNTVCIRDLSIMGLLIFNFNVLNR